MFIITMMTLLLTSDDERHHNCYNKRNQKGLANLSQSFS